MNHCDDHAELGFASLAVRAGQVRTHEGEHAEPLFLTSSFVFANAAEAAARCGGQLLLHAGSATAIRAGC